MTAKGDYRVVAYENYTPPKNIVPGQTVDKEVSVINTGNIDAFVKTALAGKINFTYLSSTNDATAISAAKTEAALADANKTGATTLYDLKENERIAIQGGGRLVTVVYDTGITDTTYNSVTTEKPLTIDSDDWNPTKGLDGTKNLTGATLKGVYIFERTADENTLVPDTDGTTKTVTAGTKLYSGYYFDGTKYYALKTLSVQGKSDDGTGTLADVTSTFTVYLDGVSVDGTSKKVKDYSYLVKKNVTADTDTAYVEASSLSNLKFDYTEVAKGSSGDSTIKVTAQYRDSTSDTLSDGVTFTITLADNWYDSWSYVDGAFYYNDDLEEGGKTAELVASVTFDDGNTNNYIDVTFDLDVRVDSVQVNEDASGKEVGDAIPDAWATADLTNSTTTATTLTEGVATDVKDGFEITKIEWSAE